MYALAIDPRDNQTLYAGTLSGGVFRSTNGAASWVAINNGLTNLNVLHLAVDPVNNQILYACTGGGIFRSNNRGSTWTANNNGLEVLTVNSLVINPVNNNILYAAAGGLVYQSINAGSSWQDISPDISGMMVMFLRLDPTNAQILYGGISGSGVYRWASNNLPVFTNLPATKDVVSMTNFTYQVEAADADGDGLSYSLENAPDNMKISHQGLISWPEPKPGIFTITVKISDGVNKPVSSTLLLKVNVTLIFTIDQREYLVNNQPRSMEVTPIIRESRTLLPIRFVSEPLGATVLWDGATRKVTIILDKTTINLWIDQPIAEVNHKLTYIDPDNPRVTPIILNSRSFVPLRFISENLGAKITWNPAKREVTINYPR